MREEPARRTAPSDEYEAEVMRGDAPVLHRDKHVARKAALAMIPGTLIFLLATIGVAAGGDPSAPRIAALVPFTLFALLLFALLTRTVVRTVLTARALEVHWGLWGPKIPLESITKCAVHSAPAGSLVGASAGWLLLAEKGAVLVQWREGARERAILVPASEPEKLVALVEQARGAASASAREAPTSVRVDASSPTARPDSAHDEAPLDASRERRAQQP